MTQRRLVVLLALAVGAAAFLVYVGSLDNEFIWDDPIVFNSQLPFFDSLHNVFVPPPRIPQFGQHYYRPLIVVTYLIDEGLAKAFWSADNRMVGRRLTYHTSPVVFHVLGAVLVFLLGVTLLRVVGPADRLGICAVAAGALVFAVHPGHTESVAWMAGRSDVVCGLFFFAALNALVRYVRDGKALWLFVVSISAFAAMLAKETALGLFVAVPLIGFLVAVRSGGSTPESPAPAPTRAERRRSERVGRTSPPRRSVAPRTRAALAVLALVPAVLIYMALREGAINTLTSPAIRGAPEFPRMAAAGAWYLVKSVWPLPLSAFVAELPADWAHLSIGFAAPLALVVLLVWMGRRGLWVRELSAGAVFFGGVAVSLMIAVYGISETPLAERYLYIPSAGVCLLGAFLLERAARRLPSRFTDGTRVALVAGVAIAIAAPASVATFHRVEVWSSNLPFWLDMVEKAPHEGIPHLHLGITYTEMNKDKEAQEQYELALRYYKDAEGLAKAHNNLGSLFMRMSRYDDAISEFRKALKEDPNYETPHYNWALTLIGELRAAKDEAVQKAQTAEAIGHFETALAINPRYVKAHFQYGALLVRLGRLAEGGRHLEAARTLAPTTLEGKESARMLARMRGGD